MVGVAGNAGGVQALGLEELTGLDSGSGSVTENWSYTVATPNTVTIVALIGGVAIIRRFPLPWDLVPI